MKDNQHNGIKKDIVHNYQFSHVISSKAPFEGIMKSFTKFYSSPNKLFKDCDCNQIVNIYLISFVIKKIKYTELKILL